MYFTIEEVSLYAERIKQIPRVISDELRGWNWNEPPIVTHSEKRLGVSDITGGLCPNGRILYLRYIQKIKEPIQLELLRGSLIHETYTMVVEQTKHYLYYAFSSNSQDYRKTLEIDMKIFKENNMRPKYGQVKDFDMVYDAVVNRGINTFSSAIDRALENSRYLSKDSIAALVVPFYVEFPIDGSLIGLHKAIRVDALIPQIPLVVEMKTREIKETHELALAGYAMAYESQYKIPVDFGLLCRVRVYNNEMRSNCELKLISDNMRERFLELRDKFLEILETEQDPGLPEYCEPDCPFLQFCGGKVRLKSKEVEKKKIQDKQQIKK
ncbi:MAG: type I-A CRISPR-associated protein Cas4/Csa1 [Sulfolobus sp.]|nr:type I-A CRISPR-associated protein Cas4/Csa1 [Sulfolobus sp.]